MAVSFFRKLCRFLCGCFEDECVPFPEGFNFRSPRQVDEFVNEEKVMARVEMAVMEVDLPDATLAKNVDLQLLEVSFDEAPQYNQVLRLARTERVARYIVPENAVYNLRLGYADDNGNGNLQVSWAAPVQLTHEDTLAPDAPGPFGEIRMVDEYVVDEEPGEPTPPGEPLPPVEEPPVEEPPVEEPPVEEPPVEPLPGEPGEDGTQPQA
jgi:hypothetical protein